MKDNTQASNLKKLIAKQISKAHKKRSKEQETKKKKKKKKQDVS